MAALTVQSFDIDGAAITTTSAAGGGDTFVNDASERTFFRITNGGGSSITVTFTSQVTSADTIGLGKVALSNLAVSVAAGVTKYIGPFSGRRFNNASGAVAVSYSGVTSVTVAAVKMGSV